MLVERLWADLGGAPDELGTICLEGSPRLLPSVFDVGALATASVALALASLSDFVQARGGGPRRAVTVDRRHAAVAFRSERYLTAVGWSLPPVWDPLAGDYETRDGFIRLHTNYRYHRDAVLRALGTAASRDAVAEAVGRADAEELETRIVAEGGCAAKMRSASEFAAHVQGRALAEEALFARTSRAASPANIPAPGPRPLDGVRVLDLTRVIAGPIGTRFLSAYGADVLRVDPPGFEEVGALLGDVTGGKRRTSLDLRAPSDRAIFERLVREAHVLVQGYRSDALERLGLGAPWRAQVNPSLVTVSLDAYGFTGPWASRRGFDSLVQMTTGIAATGQAVMGTQKPFPLPAQALDHGLGYFAAAAACHGLKRLVTNREANEFRLSLSRIALLLIELGVDGDPRGPDIGQEDVERYLEDTTSFWGPLRRVRCPGTLEGHAPRWDIPPGPLGADAPRFSN
jgi:hypothetical protein